MIEELEGLSNAAVEAQHRLREHRRGIDNVGELVHRQPEKRTAAQASSRLAVLIDADNTSWKCLNLVMGEASRHGRVVVKRGYGDFTTQKLAPWKQPMADHAILPTQAYGNTKGKNSTDSRMIIDAVELLLDRSRCLDAFCLVTSDADFTSLAMRIGEQGKTVIGIGTQQTAQSFVAACKTFIAIETLESANCSQPPFAISPKSHAFPTPLSGRPWTELQKQQLTLLHSIVVECAEEDGWALGSSVGSILKQRDPAFDPRKLGATSPKLGRLFASLDSYRIKYDEQRNV